MIIPIKYGTAQTVYFPLITAGGTNFQTTWTPAAGEYDYILDGGSPAIASLASAPVHLGNGIWSQALTVAETSGTTLVLSYSDGATDIEDQAIICSTIFSGQIEANQGIIIGEVDTATFSATATAFEAFRISPNTTEETTADHYNGRNILFTSGVCLGQMTDITDYVLANSKEKFTVTSLTEAPGDADRFVIL